MVLCGLGACSRRSPSAGGSDINVDSRVFDGLSSVNHVADAPVALQLSPLRLRGNVAFSTVDCGRNLWPLIHQMSTNTRIRRLWEVCR